MKKSLGIFCFYDSDGVVDDYIVYLLNSLKKVLFKTISVVNGSIGSESFDKLNNCVDEIVLRENIGYDATAYKEIILNHCSLNKWDAIVIFNGTFYGPFVKWENIFSTMQRYDFWGLSRDKACGKVYINSFFMVFNKRLISDLAFVDFWKQMKTPNTYIEDFVFFEEALTEYFSKRGFSWSDWYTENGGNDVNSGLICRKILLEELVEKYHFPIIKYKCFSVVQYFEALKNKQFIIDKTSYDYRLIEQHQSRLERKNKIYPFSKKTLDEFLGKYKAVYIFGHGVYGKGIAEYCQNNGNAIIGFVVSSPNSNDEIAIKDVKLCKNRGMIVAVGAKMKDDVCASIYDVGLKEHVLFPI